MLCLIGSKTLNVGLEDGVNGEGVLLQAQPLALFFGSGGFLGDVLEAGEGFLGFNLPVFIGLGQSLDEGGLLYKLKAIGTKSWNVE